MGFCLESMCESRVDKKWAIDERITIRIGQRIIVRDSEWVVRRVDLLRDGGYRLECDGVSSFVKGKEAIFVSTCEKEIVVIDPAKTRLIADGSSAYECQ